jgi:hypothetical protein
MAVTEIAITSVGNYVCERHGDGTSRHFRTVEGKPLCWHCLTPAEKATAPCECDGPACRAKRAAQGR